MTYATSFLHKPTNCLLHFWTFFHYQEKLTQLTENKNQQKKLKNLKKKYIYKTNNLKKKPKPSCAKKQFIYIYQEAKLIDVSLENNI